MFYSQFILAKKGPLGTIWIAAHLERKLRKNQVADTDIGFSVDSILFPDIPIALRLSSHLLLGVVRIYSRKVNYLFDDCSEALLKIKQAFRSTAVDLPPEESTAPYHSITLPETFDLDDFELPDGDIFQGNYVDHHVSTKEQITLQDPMDGVVYTTSKFGLDERFGDGDTSQVALDLEEDMFLDKVTALPEEILEANAGTSGVAPAQLTESSTPLPPEGMAVDLEAGDYAQAPSTPGLVNEPNLSNFQERLASEDHLESEDHNLTESVGMDGRDNTSVKLDLHCVDDETGFSPYNHANDYPMGAITEEADVEVNKENVKGKSLADRLAIDDVEDQNKTASNNEPGEPIDGKSGEYVEVTLHDFKDSGVDIEGRERHGLDFGPVAQAGLEPEDPDTLNNHNKDEQIRSSSISVLRACSSLSTIPLEDRPRTLEKDEELGEDEPCTLEKDEERSASETVKIIQGHVDTDNGQVEKIQLVEPDSTMPSDNQFEELDGSMTCELPAPEKLLSAPQMALDMPVSLLIESTPDKEDQEEADVSSAGDKVSAKKRTFVDSMEPMQCTNTADTFNMSKSRRTTNSIPDDDDLLSSILAGVGSSALKIKPSPAPLEVSRKRVRSTSRASAMKRKVLVDDSMVLLGDIIRQQLTNTEDIRRLRKKAPCTRTEIVIIQRQFLEEEIFSDSVLTGMALKLTQLHCEKLDLSRIEVTENDGNTGLLETGHGNEFSPRPLTEDDSAQGDPESSNSKDVSDKQCKELPVQGANQQGEGQQLQSEDIDHHRDSSGVGVIPDAGASEVEPSGEVTDMEFDQANNSLLLGEQASGNPPGSGNEPTLVDRTDRNGPSLSSTISGENLDGVNILGNCTDNLTVTAADLGEDEESLLPSEADKLVEMTADIQINGNALTDDVGPAFFNVLSEKEGCINADSLNVVEEAPELESNKLGVNEGGVTVSPGYDDKDQFAAYLQREDCRLSTGPVADIKDDSFHETDYVVGCETDQQSAMDTGHPFVGHYTEGDFPEPQDISFANDTGFLNVDDNDLAEDDDDIPGAEDAQLFDNSGWSSRTRAVGNYLQTLFDKEAEHGRKFLSVDRLLTGKTRKEASRMFFETLVLKTKDYIHVEQENPFENINIKARAKLMKSEF